MSNERKIVCRPHGNGQLTMLLTDAEINLLMKIEQEYPDMDIIGHLQKMEELQKKA